MKLSRFKLLFKAVIQSLRRLITVPRPCDCLPVEVPDDAVILRAVSHPFHVHSNGTLKWEAFEPPDGRNDISVMRLACLGADECKRRAKAMNDPKKTYKGFAVLSAESARSTKCEVKDSREEYCGHADLILGIARFSEDGEPPEDQIPTARLRAIAKDLKAKARYVQDPRSDEDRWPSELALEPLA